MSREFCYTIEKEHEGLTVNSYARTILGMSMHFVRSVKFKENGICVNGQQVTTRYALKTGDRLVFTVHDEKNLSVKATKGKVNILYENQDFVVINKQAGMVVHPCHGHYTDTLLNHLTWYYEQKGEQWLLRPVGRLDQDTSGAIIIAKNRHATRFFEKQREDGILIREYLALVTGYFKEPGAKGLIDRPIAAMAECRNKYHVHPNGRPSKTHYEVIAHGMIETTPYTLVRLHLETGRTHQIRVHMADCGHPLIGDPIYGQTGILGMKRAALHSVRIQWVRMEDGKKQIFEAEMPEDFNKFLNKGK